MSEDQFHVHGAHDHAVEHAAGHGGSDPLANRIAVASAVLATLGALMTLASGDTQADAQLYKNTASIMKTRANDEWNYYQAKGLKANLAQIGAAVVAKPEDIDHFHKEAARYKKQQLAIKDRADELEKQVKVWDARSEEQIHLHHRWAAGATAMQIAIALSAITLLARRTWLLWCVGLVAAAGLGFGGMALAGI